MLEFVIIYACDCLWSFFFISYSQNSRIKEAFTMSADWVALDLLRQRSNCAYDTVWGIMGKNAGIIEEI